MMDMIQRANGAIARSFAWIGGFALLASSLLVGLDVLLRKFAGLSTGGSDELAGYALALVVSLGTGFALLERAHVRIDVFVQMLPNRPRAWVEVFGLSVFFVFLAVLIWSCGTQYVDTIRHNSHSITPMQTPLWIPQTIWVFGLAFAVWVCAVLLLKLLGLAIRGHYDTVIEEIGMSQLEREITDELRELDQTSDALGGDRR